MTQRKQTVRRSNEERSAETRGRLIEAAIDSLIEVGHVATTTARVAQKARVSRGAMLHHFPSRAALMAAVAEDIQHRHRQLRHERLATLSPWERFIAAGDVSWDVQARPDARALLEIMLAAIGDRELHRDLTPLLKLREQLRKEAAKRIAQDLQAEDTQPVADLVRLHTACLLGLSIELAFSGDRAGIERARVLFTSLEHEWGRKMRQPRKQAARKRSRSRSG